MKTSTMCAASLAAVLALAFLGAASADAGWIPARSTWFDIGPDLSRANCHFSWTPTGRDVGAFSDQMDGFSSSCGRCYEVKCRNSQITDGYGQSMDRSNACFDEAKSVIITIADACPCRYPNNEYSNQRWCCGDMNHVDLSREAFEQIADLGLGVIGLYMREVDCGTSGNPGNGNPTPASQYSGGSQDQQSAGSNDPSWGGWGDWTPKKGGRWGRHRV
ncbi:hypothetical protein HXX76_002752 [Chlamydomonas incerta]|uniref:Expansin-like EG45 domain-containing protein n=1 Tax=Chlamydomonas incerta TaxID=51695 RepID=A0A835TLB7_CHLIN|nr:hypothetical protein HXX76_002752 [Chlamydomonas incerta]|eukprot:KAG2442669.1 hypothetical protein HXX76_002752 [Chlamydomonas incerta]